MIEFAFVLHTWQNAAETLASAATVVAIVVGGIWAYWGFVRERNRWPRGELTLEVTHRHLDDEICVLHAKLRIKNVGRGLMKLEEMRVDLQRVRPLGEHMRSALRRGKPFNSTGYQADWPEIDQHVICWKESQPELEPGETDEFPVDFFIQPAEEVVFVYAYLRNVRKKGQPLGWPATAFYDIEEAKDPTRDK